MKDLLDRRQSNSEFAGKFNPAMSAFLHVWSRQTLEGVEFQSGVLRQRWAIDLEIDC